jgi:uncharacterized OB-fold protein
MTGSRSVTGRPGPVGRNEHSAFFFDGTAEGVFMLLKCPNGHWNRPQNVMCASCGSSELTPSPASGRATLVSWVVVHPRPPADGSEPGPPTVPAIVELAEGPWWWTQLVDVELPKLKAGDALEVVFEHGEHSEVFPAFSPASS